MIKTMIVKGIGLYKTYVSPFLGINCKYYPSCSRYFIESIEKNGYRGILQGIYRIIRCNPFSQGGYDPVKKIG